MTAFVFRAAALCVCLAGCAMSVEAWGASGGLVYKWVDARGVVHYSDKPARGGEAVRGERVLDAGEMASPADAGATRKLADDLRAGAEKRREVSEAGKAAQESAAQRASQERACSAAREAVRVLEAGGRMATVTEGGEKAILSEAEIATKAAEARKSADEACAPPKPQAPAASAPPASPAK